MAGAGLDLQHAAHMIEYAPHRSVHLRHAAQAISVLHPRIVLAVRFANLRAFQQLHQMLCGGNLPGVRPCLVNARVEGGRSALQRLQ